MHSNSSPRRYHSAELKAKVLAACEEPGASISAVALAHGLNTNLVGKWRSGRGLKRAGIATPTSAPEAAPADVTPATEEPSVGSAMRFVPVELSTPAQATRAVPESRLGPAPVVPEPIRVELRRGTLHLDVRWPASAASDCAAWLRELTSGLSK